jgi:hypothetical protein
MSISGIVISSSLRAILIPLINAQLSFPLFSDSMQTSLEGEPLLFFSNYHLLSAQTFSTIPPVTMTFLWNPENNDIIKMNGTRDAVFDNLEKLGLDLSRKNLIPYIKFVLSNVSSEEGTLRLIESYSDVEYSREATKEEVHFLKKYDYTPEVAETSDGGYKVKCAVIYGDTLYEADIAVNGNGVFEFKDEHEVRSGLPVRQIFLE